jgi:hypothetical protein
MVNSPTDGLSDEERLLRQAIDDAFVQCITRLMANWMIDDEDQPERAFRGIRKAIDIWQEAIRAIETGEI